MNFFTFFNFRINIKPFETIEFLREGIQISAQLLKLKMGVFL